MAHAVTDDIEKVDGGIRVRKDSGSFRRVETPAGFTDYVFKNAVVAFDTAYRYYGSLPDVEQVQKFFPRIPLTTYSKLFITDEFKQALAYRGIEWEVDSGLSMEMSMALLKLLDPHDRRPQTVKLKELGIPYPKFQNWMRNPLFKESYNKRTEENMKDAVPMALNNLIGNAGAGDQRAIEKVLEITGRWNPAQQQLEDAKTVVVKVVEAVIKHVQDPEIRKLIMQDVQAEVVSYDLLHQQALER